MTPLEQLHEARTNLIQARNWLAESTARWCKDEFGYDKAGFIGPARASHGHLDVAESCCTLGAVWKFGSHVDALALTCSLAVELLEYSVTADDDDGDRLYVPDFNDHEDTEHADVIALFDRAITEANERIARLEAKS